MRFKDFESLAAEYFGIEPGGEARDFADAIEASGQPLRGVDTDDSEFWIHAADVLDAFVEPYYDEAIHEPIERYPLDRHFPGGDEYLEAGIEWEMTAESEEGYGER